MTGIKRPTLVDVAARAGVDKAVVSRILSGDAALRVRDETRQRVLEAVEDLEYHRNSVARSLRAERAGAIGLVIPTYDNPVYSAVIDGAATAAAAHEAFLLTASVKMLAAAGESPLDLIRSGRIDGLLLAGTSIDLQGPSRMKDRLPCVSVNRRIPGYERWLVLDDQGAARLAVDHLRDLGHTQIGHIAGPASADTAERRLRGFIEAVRAAGLDDRTELIARSDYTSRGGVNAARTLVNLDRSPTAIVVANLASAVGVLFGLRKSGLRVPDDVSVVAIHDLPLAEFLEPPLTVVKMPLAELGRRGVELLLTTTPSADINEVVAEPMILITRASTAPPPPGRRRT